MSNGLRNTWAKSSCSGSTGGQCVEVAHVADRVWIRDSKDPAGPWLSVRPGCWSRWLAGLRAGLPTLGTCLSALSEGSVIVLRRGREAGLRFSGAEWAAFQCGVGDGQFDVPGPPVPPCEGIRAGTATCCERRPSACLPVSRDGTPKWRADPWLPEVTAADSRLAGTPGA